MTQLNSILYLLHQFLYVLIVCTAVEVMEISKRQQQIQLSKLFLKYSVYLMFGFLFLLILFKCKRKKQKQPSVNNK